MLQGHACVSVHCDQCGDSLGAPEFQAHYPSEDAALGAAATDGWRLSPDGRLYCSECGPVLTCEAQGHKFTPWRAVLACQDELDELVTGTSTAQQAVTGESPALPAGASHTTTEGHPVSREYRYCRRCCLFDSRQNPTLSAPRGSGTTHQTRQRTLATAAGAGGVGEVA
jgi:hypothetical protein